MPITPQQARAELARRELARRELARRQAVPPPTRTQRVEREGVSRLLSPFEQIRQRQQQVISGRESRTAQAQRLYGESPSEILKHPVGLLLNAIGAGYETLEGVPANIGLGIQRGAPAREILGDIGQMLQGQRPAQLGDIMRSSGIPVLQSEPVAALTGLALMPGGARTKTGGPTLTAATAKTGIGAAKVGLGATRAGFRSTGRGLVRTGQFLTGDRPAIRKADTAITQAAEDLIRSYRRGGANYESAVSKLSVAQDAAWAPAQQAARSIPTQITKQELEAIATQRLSAPEDAQRLQDVMSAIGRLADTAKKEVFSGEELLSFSSDLGESIPQAVVKGARSLRRPNLVQTDSRAVLLDAIERNAPSGSKGLLAEGFKSYRNYKDVESQWYRVVKPKAGQLAETGGGPAILRKAAGVRSEVPQNLDPETIVQNINKVFGIDLTQPLQKPVSQLRRAETVGKVGKTVGTGLATATGAGGLGLLLRSILGGRYE